MDSKSELRVLNNKPAVEGLNRREMVQRLLGGAGAASAFMPAGAAAHPMHKHLMNAATLAQADAKAASTNWKPEFLDPHQAETLTVLAERIVPGSTKAGVTPFVDLLLSVDTQENQRKFLASLGALEAEAINEHSRPFKELSEDQQNAILTKACNEKPSHSDENADFSWFAVPSKETGETPRVTLRDYFENVKGWVSGAYYSSEVGMRELGWTGQVAWDSFPGCEHPEGHH
jgi:hypothetical protein